MPPGVALSGAIVEAVAAGEEEAIETVVELVRPLGGPLAVRSSAVDEDGADASFAGQHLTLLNVPSWEELTAAVSEIWWSANSDSAITYRQRVGLFTRPSVGVVVQALLDPDTAGVMFTQNPVTGADERMIEASLGPRRGGRRRARDPGQLPRRPLRRGARADAGPQEDRGSHACRAAAPSRSRCRASSPSSSASTTASSRSSTSLADRCEQVYGRARDIEWAIAGGTLYLLQCRAVTRAGSERARARAGLAARH